MRIILNVAWLRSVLHDRVGNACGSYVYLQVHISNAQLAYSLVKQSSCLQSCRRVNCASSETKYRQQND